MVPHCQCQYLNRTCVINILIHKRKEKGKRKISCQEGYYGKSYEEVVANRGNSGNGCCENLVKFPEISTEQTMGK